MKNILIGKKTVLYKVIPKDVISFTKSIDDMDGYWRLGYWAWDLINDNWQEILKQVIEDKMLVFWWARTKEGRGSRTIGFFWLNPVTEFWYNLEGLINDGFVAGLDKELKIGKYTYLEDALRGLIDNNPIPRLGFISPPTQTGILDLLKSIGFNKEGILKQAIKTDNENYRDAVLYAKIREVK